MEILLDPNLWIAFAMLTALEIVLGIDNIIFISILVGRLPPHLRDKARRLGLGFAMVSRLLLLLPLRVVRGLTATVSSLTGQATSGPARSARAVADHRALVVRVAPRP